MKIQVRAGRTVTWRAVALWAALVLVASACGGDGEGSELAPAATVGSPGCEASGEPAGTEEFLSREVVVDGASRSYLLYAPTSRYFEQPAPLVLNHHGLSQTAAQQRVMSGFHELAEDEGIVVAYPDAGDKSWNFDDDSDIAYVEAVIDDVAASICIDENRVYAIGMSQGGGFSTLLACRLADRIAGAASVAMLHHHEAPSCETPVSTPVLTVVGSSDTIYSIEDGLQLPAASVDVPGPLAAETGAWIETNECEPDPVETNLERGAVRRDYSCADGNQLAVIVHGGGHVWPRALDGLDTNRLVWGFFSGSPEA